MVKYEDYIGKNIREMRNIRGYSQEKLARLCGFSNTTLSAYETSKKTPNLITVAKIASSLNVSIDRLYYGDESKAFISMAPDEGRKIVNCIYTLWDLGVINYYENMIYNRFPFEEKNHKKKQGVYLFICKYSESIKRLIESLNEFKQKEHTYKEPEVYLEMLLGSVAEEINQTIERNNIKKKEMD